MRRFELPLAQYNSDKIKNRFLERYDPMLAPWLDKEITLLEIGVRTGGSLELWRDYFERGTIAGIDIALPKDFTATERIHLFEGSQADPEFLTLVANEIAPDGFDIIIDDASHIGELTKAAFWHLFENHLKPGGMYVIEDWGTGYWDDWPDGKSLELDHYTESKNARQVSEEKTPMPGHNYGMVGFIKQLVDEQGAHDVTRKNYKGRIERWSKFESMTITPSIVFIKKPMEDQAPI